MTEHPVCLLEMADAAIVENGAVALRATQFSLFQGQQWAVIGQPETAKNLFLRAIAGKAAVSQGAIHHHYATSYLQAASTVDGYRTHHDLVAYVPFHHHFRNKSNTQTFYYQQRFNSADADDAPTVREMLNGIQPKTPDIRWTPEQAIALFGLHPLADETLIKLSNGETRRLMLATALVRNPSLLLLDNPLIGLDVETRGRFDQILEAIVASGIHVIMTTSPREIPSCITHVAVIQQDRITEQGIKTEVTWMGEEPLVSGVGVSDEISGAIRELLPDRPEAIASPIVSLKNVRVRYGDKRILDQVTWEVKPGEAWALRGHNGAGKSTLLSLINGDNPQAYSNDIVLFGRKRGTGESIWDIKRRIGYVSPELHQYFPKTQTVLQVVLSGFFDTVGLFRKVTATQRETALRWLGLFGMADAATRRLSQLSPDRQRLCLLARAVIKNPTLLILDEPCQGLSVQHRDFFKALVDELHRTAHTTLIYVSHYLEDIPSCVTKRILLEQGKVVEKTS